MTGLSKRIRSVQAPVIPLVAELIRDHPGTISLGQGVVNYGPPPEALEMLSTFSADPDNHKYQHVQGIPALLAALAEKLETENGISPARREVVVTAGSNMGFMSALAAIADPGDEIILLAPYYFNQEMAVRIAGCVPVVVPTDAAFQPVVERIEAVITERTRAVVTISPNNPTGAVYAEERLVAINDLCGARSLFHISDEAYEYFTYEGARHFSPAAAPGASPHTIGLYTLSKAYGFASWRIGYLSIPEHLCDAIKKIQDTNLICPPVVSQHAALGALRAGRGYCLERVAALGGVRRLVLDELARLGDRVEVPEAAGAFYFLVKVASREDPMRLVERLVREHRVAAIPGSTFGADGCSLRIAYGALERDTVAQGMGRLVAGLEQILG